MRGFLHFNSVSSWPGTGRLRRFLHDRGGVVAIELALVAAPFFFVVGCIIEQGAIMLTDYSLQKGTESAARLIRIGEAPATLDDFRLEVCSAALVVPGCSTTNPPAIAIESADTFAQLGTALAGTYATGKGSSAILVKVTYDWQYLLPINHLLQLMGAEGPTWADGPYRMTAVSVFRNEPF